jgi:hypothetical protein
VQEDGRGLNCRSSKTYKLSKQRQKMLYICLYLLREEERGVELYIFTDAYIYIYIYIYICIYVCEYAYKYIVYTNMYMHVCVCLCACTCTYILS